MKMSKIKPGQLSGAAETILGAGCSGVGQLAWNLRYFLDRKIPDFPAGDTWHDDKRLHEALESALKLYASTDGAEPPAERTPND